MSTPGALLLLDVGAFTLAAGSGTVTITGTAATLIYTAVYVLSAASGTVTITGTVATLVYTATTVTGRPFDSPVFTTRVLGGSVAA